MRFELKFMEGQVESKSNGNMMAIGAVLIAIALVVGGIIFLSGQSNQNTTPSPSSTPLVQAQQTPTPVANSSTPSAITTIDLEAGSFYYKPNEIRVKKGDKIKIVMTSKDMMHDFNIEELNVHLPITRSGNTNTVEFTADKSGTFEYYCSVGSHRKQGQVGKIIIE